VIFFYFTVVTQPSSFGEKTVAVSWSLSRYSDRYYKCNIVSTSTYRPELPRLESEYKKNEASSVNSGSVLLSKKN